MMLERVRKKVASLFCLYVAPPSQPRACHWYSNTFTPLPSLALLLNPRYMFQSQFSWFPQQKLTLVIILSFLKALSRLLLSYILYFPGFPLSFWLSHFKSPMQAYLLLPRPREEVPSGSLLVLLLFLPSLTPYISIVLITSDWQI